MQRARHGLGRPAAVLVAVALLLAPLAMRAHWHGAGEAAPRCAVCVAAHHSPALVELGPVGVLPRVQGHAVALPDLGGAGSAYSARPSGRSPPVLLILGVV